jgi:hypothetical protein
MKSQLFLMLCGFLAFAAMNNATAAIITIDVDTFQGTKWRGRFSKIRLSLYHVHLHGLHKRKERN